MVGVMTMTDSGERAGRSIRGRVLVGPVLITIGVLHCATAPVFYGDSLRSILDAGVVASVEADPALVMLRAAGFWYLSAGIGMLALGALAWWVERTVGVVPALLGWLLLALTVWGVTLMPVSGFWAFLVPAALAFRSARRGAVPASR